MNKPTVEEQSAIRTAIEEAYGTHGFSEEVFQGLEEIFHQEQRQREIALLEELLAKVESPKTGNILYECQFYINEKIKELKGGTE